MNRASRVASKADTGLVLCSTAAWHHASQRPDFAAMRIVADPLGEFEMKGVAGPMALVHCRFDAQTHGGIKRHASDLVGGEGNAGGGTLTSPSAAERHSASSVNHRSPDGRAAAELDTSHFYEAAAATSLPAVDRDSQQRTSSLLGPTWPVAPSSHPSLNQTHQASRSSSGMLQHRGSSGIGLPTLYEAPSSPPPAAARTEAAISPSATTDAALSQQGRPNHQATSAQQPGAVVDNVHRWSDSDSVVHPSPTPSAPETSSHCEVLPFLGIPDVTAQRAASRSLLEPAAGISSLGRSLQLSPSGSSLLPGASSGYPRQHLGNSPLSVSSGASLPSSLHSGILYGERPPSAAAAISGSFIDPALLRSHRSIGSIAPVHLQSRYSKDLALSLGMRRDTHQLTMRAGPLADALSPGLNQSSRSSRIAGEPLVHGGSTETEKAKPGSVRAEEVLVFRASDI